MSSDSSLPTKKQCPACGTLLNRNAARCSACGAQQPVDPAQAGPETRTRVPVLSLSLPVLTAVAIIFMLVGAGVVYAAVRPQSAEPTAEAVAAVTDTVAPTSSPTASLEPSATVSPTPEITFTPLPPIEYQVTAGDNCGTIASHFDVSSKSIQDLNHLSVDCMLTIGQTLLIPVPTVTPFPSPSPTLNPTEAARQECEKMEYVVKENDLLGGIAANYGVKPEAIREYSGLTSDVVWIGQKLIIPLCDRSFETPTPTPIPPYPPATQLLPAQGTSYGPADVVALQWASVGELAENERYMIVIEDITEGSARKLVEYVEGTKFNIPESFRPAGNTPHAFQWYVSVARQTGSEPVAEGTPAASTEEPAEKPIWEEAGTPSETRIFIWTGN